MAMIEAAVDVQAPRDMTYNQWTQFEDYPQFMEAVEQVDQLDDTTLRWRVAFSGATREFVADITTQEPETCVAWVSREGQGHSGTVRFSDLPDGSTRIEVEMDYDTATWTDTVARMLNLVDMQVKDDLRRFKDFIENRARETGAWRGSVHGGTRDGGPG